jgi:hypothetical protein
MSFVKRQSALAKLTMEQLVARQKAIEADPASLNTPGKLHIYNKRAEQKLDDIAWAITYKLQEKK